MTLVFLGLGANLHDENGRLPRDTLLAAVDVLAQKGLEVEAVAPWYESEPVPATSEQPWYVNGVLAVETDLSPSSLMAVLLDVEAQFGRDRTKKWAPRIIDLDILSYGSTILPSKVRWAAGVKGKELVIPHPYMHERRFVLAPLADIAPTWRHPVLGKTAEELLGSLPHDDIVRPMT